VLARPLNPRKLPPVTLEEPPNPRVLHNTKQRKEPAVTSGEHTVGHWYVHMPARQGQVPTYDVVATRSVGGLFTADPRPRYVGGTRTFFGCTAAGEVPCCHDSIKLPRSRWAFTICTAT
jgi:hypothetical protein